MFDPLGLSKDDPASPGQAVPGGEDIIPKEKPARIPWGVLLALDAVLIVVCAGALYVRIASHRGRTVPPPEAKEARAERPAVKKEEPKKETPQPKEPQKPATKPEPAPAKAPEPPPVKPAKGPIGSPSVNAPELPKRGTPSPAALGTAPAEKAPRAPAAPDGTAAPTSTAKPGARSQPVEFSYPAPEAKEVSLMGAFLVRAGGRKGMYKDAQGVWRITVYLNTGSAYRYRFEVLDSRGKKSLTPRQSVTVP